MTTDESPRRSERLASAGGQRSQGSRPGREAPLITAVEIENFKGIGRPVRIDLRPITLLFGPNSAGKSTVLHALCYAHEILSRGNVDARETRLGGEQINLGGFHRFVHAYARNREVRLSFELNLRGRSVPYLADADEALAPPPWNRGVLSGLHEGWLVLSVVWSDDRKAPVVRDCEVGVDGQILGCISRAGGAAADLLVNSGHPFAEYAKALLAGFGRLVRDELSQLRYVGPLRNRHPYTVAGQATPALGRWADGSAAWHLLNDHASEGGDELVRSVSDWLSRDDRLATGYALRVDQLQPPDLPEDDLVGWLSFEHGVLTNAESSQERLAEVPQGNTPGSSGCGDAVPNSIAYKVNLGTGVLGTDVAERNVRRIVHVVNTWVGRSAGMSDVGTGISQILPVIVAALDPNRPGITAIEQPELHVHPRLQVELGDLFAHRVERGGIFLLETHSEHLLLRIMRRMRETSAGTLPDGGPGLSPQDVNVLFVEHHDGQTVIREMPLNERGELVKAWPGGFFEEDLREIF